MIKYVIHTESIQGTAQLADIVSKYFEAFNISESMGYWKGKREVSAQIVVIGNDAVKIKELAEEINEDL